jgi:hypothetical protein
VTSSTRVSLGSAGLASDGAATGTNTHVPNSNAAMFLADLASKGHRVWFADTRMPATTSGQASYRPGLLLENRRRVRRDRADFPTQLISAQYVTSHANLQTPRVSIE